MVAVGRDLGGVGFRLGGVARERDRRPELVARVDAIEGIGGLGGTVRGASRFSGSAPDDSQAREL